MPTLYDLATTAVIALYFLLLAVSIVMLFRRPMPPLAAVIWFAIVVFLPFIGPTAFFLYVVQDNRR